MYKGFLEKVKEFETIIIHRHSRPDGDALGSQIGLKEALLLNFPNKDVLVVGDTNERLKFIGEMDEVNDEKYNDALVIILDTPEEIMISDERYKNGKYLIKIDHHLPRSSFGNLEIIDTSFESCASLVANIIFDLRMEINEKSAKALFTGVVTDSGRFRYSSVNSNTFIIASKLVATGFSLSDVYNSLYIEEYNLVKLRAEFTLKFELTKNKVAYIKTTKEEVKNYGVDIFTISRGMVNTMSGIKGIDIWVNFTEDEVNNCIIAELRSNKYNINEIAVKYGGGGHLLASGASLESFAVADKMLADLDQLIEVDKNDK